MFNIGIIIKYVNIFKYVQQVDYERNESIALLYDLRILILVSSVKYLYRKILFKKKLTSEFMRKIHGCTFFIFFFLFFFLYS